MSLLATPLATELILIFVFSLMSVQLFQPRPTQIMLLASPLVFVGRPRLLLTIPKYWYLYLLPILATVSFFWSDEPSVSMKYGWQFLATVIMGAAAVLSLTPRGFIRLFLLASSIIGVLSIASHNQGGATPIDGGVALIGLTGAKNQMSFVGQLMLITGIAVVIDKGQPKLLRLWALPAMPIGLYILAASKSGGGNVGAAIGVVSMLAFTVTRAMGLRWRILAFAGVILMAIPAAVGANVIEEKVADFQQNVLHKDKGLTGRAYLWAQADKLIAERPLIGHGYRAIWLGNSTTTIGLLRFAGVPDGKGFNFHNTYREVLVDEGIVGLIAMLFMMGYTAVRLPIQMLLDPTPARMFFATTFIMYVARTYTEYILVPFSHSVVLFHACAIHAAVAHVPMDRFFKKPAAPMRGRAPKVERGETSVIGRAPETVVRPPRRSTF